MLYSFASLVCLFLGIGHVTSINDFKVGLNFCDGDFGDNTGVVEYSKWFSVDTGKSGASDWASDSNYYDPDCGKIYIKGRQLSSLDTDTLRIPKDIRLCIQASDHIDGPDGDPSQKGDWGCTPWATDGGGWSDWVNDENCYDPDAWRIRVDKRSRSDNLLISDIKSGIQFTDGCEKSSKTGEKEYTSWLIGSGDTVVASGWAGDSNNYDFDSMRIYLGTKEVEETPSPTRKPTWKPTPKPTDKPTRKPTWKPTAKPTDKPTDSPTRKPTWKPTDKPTKSPTRKPTWKPTDKPTKSPTRKPTWKPTDKPTGSPTRKPTWKPTDKPTPSPTRKPTWSPTESPTESPTRRPTWSPTEKPTEYPTRRPTWSPTRRPTWKPTAKPTRSPTTWTKK